MQSVRWEDGFAISVRLDGDAIILSANREGMLSLANIMRDMAGEAPGSHVHLDVFNSLEKGSLELIIEKIE